jgi:hypothetical protein
MVHDPIHDFVWALEDYWRMLAVYYAVIIMITVFVWWQFGLSRFLHQRKGRVILAAVLTVLFTPSVISDFWLFMVPGPAVVGLLFILPASVIQPVFLLVALAYYIIPLAAVFYIIRFVFWACERHHAPPRQTI